MRRAFVVAASLSLAWVAIGLAGNPALTSMEWKVADVSRQALVHVPPGAMKAATPVVFAFHGHGGSMRQAASSFAYHRFWPEAIVVYMQGLNTPGRLTDPEGKKPGWQHDKGEQQDRDLKFFDAVLTSLRKDYQVDARRIYATGHSNGGAFTYLLWAQRSDVFAALAPFRRHPQQDLENLKARPVLHVAGAEDPLVKYEWQELAMGLVRKVNGCDAAGTEWAKAGTLTGTEHRSKNGAPFVSLIHPGGHMFPSEAPELVVRFFKQHSLAVSD